jgi:pyrroloquinoline quinone biosynthesis protein E
LTGEAARADPVCALSPDHEVIDRARRHAAAAPPAFIYRRIGAARECFGGLSGG